MRVLFWLGLGLLLLIGLKRLGGGARRTGSGPAGATERVEEMVRCASCSLNLPRSEAVPFAGGWACCAAHAKGGSPAAQP